MDKITAELKSWRVGKKLSQEELAEILGCDQASVSFWERGQVLPLGPTRVLLELLLSGKICIRTIKKLGVKHGRF